MFSTLSSTERSGKPALLGLSDYYKVKDAKNPFVQGDFFEIGKKSEIEDGIEKDKKMAFALASAMLLASKPKVSSLQASIESFLGE